MDRIELSPQTLAELKEAAIRLSVSPAELAERAVRAHLTYLEEIEGGNEQARQTLHQMDRAAEHPSVIEVTRKEVEDALIALEAREPIGEPIPPELQGIATAGSRRDPGVSPQIEVARENEENLWQKVAVEFGLLGAVEAARLAGREGDRTWAVAQRQAGRILTVHRYGQHRYPGYQFNAEGLRPVIAELIKIGRRHGWSEAGLALWTVSPTTYVEGDMRPVDIIDQEERLLEIADASLGTVW